MSVINRASPRHIIEVRDLTVGFGETIIFRNLDLDVNRAEILGFVGGSGTGKSVLLRTILELIPKREGSIRLFGTDIDDISAQQRSDIDRRIGVLFQMGALFSSLTVLENIQVPMREHFKVSRRLMDDLALMKMEMVGLKRTDADKFPSELSGGMIKRAGLARALALDPDLLFLDEPTSGLDPISAAKFDLLIQELARAQGLTVYMVTHDLDSLYSVCDRVAVLADKTVVANAPVADLLDNPHPWIQSYFRGERGQRFIDAGLASAARRESTPA